MDQQALGHNREERQRTSGQGQPVSQPLML
jgi:hypothetical protein